MDMITNALKKAPKRKGSGESLEYAFKVLTSPPRVGGSYSFDGCFYYVPGQFREPKTKKGKITKEEGRKEASAQQASVKIGEKPKEMLGKSASSSSGPTMKKTTLKPHDVRKSIKRLEDLRREEEVKKGEGLELTLEKEGAKGSGKRKDRKKAIEETTKRTEDACFAPAWGIKASDKITRLEDCENYLVHSVPEGVEASFMKMKKSWFHDHEMLRRYRNCMEKTEKDIVIKKSLREELAKMKKAKEALEAKKKSLEEENAKLKEEFETERKKRKNWEDGFNKEHLCRKKWEEATEALREKYEDEERNIKK